jgi:hypothetical protein
VILSLGLGGIQILDNPLRFFGIGILGLLTLVLFTWSLKEGLGKNMTLVSLILPVAFTLGVGLFWFLLPSSIYARIPIVILYGFGIYALCLTSNIYIVAAIRTIALHRAAKGVGFILTLLTIFLLLDTLTSIRLNILFNSFLVFLATFPLFFQGLWSTTLDRNFSLDILKLSFVSSLVASELAIILFYWPVTLIVGSLCLTVTSYIVLGLSQAHLEGRLFSQTVKEYLFVGIAVFIGMFVATRWG